MLGGFAMNNKLQGKDLINIGIFTAIYFIVIFAAASIGFIPIFIPLISVIVPLVGGIPMMLFFSKIKKFGMLTICGVHQLRYRVTYHMQEPVRIRSEA